MHGFDPFFVSFIRDLCRLRISKGFQFVGDAEVDLPETFLVDLLSFLVPLLLSSVFSFFYGNLKSFLGAQEILSRLFPNFW